MPASTRIEWQRDLHRASGRSHRGVQHSCLALQYPPAVGLVPVHGMTARSNSTSSTLMGSRSSLDRFFRAFDRVSDRLPRGQL